MSTIMVKSRTLLLLGTYALAVSCAAVPSCKCAPTDSCWPTATQWSSLNSTVAGKLIATTPIAISCYPGAAADPATCASVDAHWSTADFQSNNPVGLSYPINEACPPINATAGETPGSCSIGTNPRYAVNATSVAYISAAIKFATKYNIRLVIKDTGHDILGRSDGYGSLEIWIRHLRTGVKFQKANTCGCSSSSWTGSTFVIGGGYTWSDVYPIAQANNVVVVGGGTPSVGCLGGWMQGGGHGPASRQYGLGADQLLEATVVLSDGSVVTANACQNQDVFFAIRGGGGGTYGVVTSATVKAHPNVNVSVQHVAIAPLTSNTSSLLDAVTVLFGAYPSLNDQGYAGYGQWTIASPTPLFATFYAGYVHGFYTMNSTVAATTAAFAPTLTKLNAFNSSLFISVTYVSYPDYWSFYHAESGVEPPVGTSAALGSRLFSKADVTNNPTGLRAMIGVIAGTPDQYSSNNFELVSGGQVFKDASDPYSGLNPAWRISYFNNIIARGWAPGSSQATINGVFNDITYTKVAAMQKQAPDTGTYMNEGDRFDPNYKVDFYGTHYSKLYAIKTARDPKGIFYCPTCVGSDLWTQDSTGRLCRT